MVAILFPSLIIAGSYSELLRVLSFSAPLHTVRIKIPFCKNGRAISYRFPFSGIIPHHLIRLFSSRLRQFPVYFFLLIHTLPVYAQPPSLNIITLSHLCFLAYLYSYLLQIQIVAINNSLRSLCFSYSKSPLVCLEEERLEVVLVCMHR